MNGCYKRGWYFLVGKVCPSEIWALCLGVVGSTLLSIIVPICGGKRTVGQKLSSVMSRACDR